MKHRHLTIPEVRVRLARLAGRQRVIAHEIAELVEELRRREAITRAPPHAAKMSDDLRARIRAYAKAHPDMTQMAMAQWFGVNPGRISETLAGKRGAKT